MMLLTVEPLKPKPRQMRRNVFSLRQENSEQSRMWLRMQRLKKCGVTWPWSWLNWHHCASDTLKSIRKSLRSEAPSKRYRNHSKTRRTVFLIPSWTRPSWRRQPMFSLQGCLPSANPSSNRWIKKASSTTTCRALLRNRRQCTISHYRG